MANVDMSSEEIEEFKIEATELLDKAEEALLKLDKGGDFKTNFDAIFRAFHSVKGAAGMLGWETLQHHMHQVENHFQNCKQEITLSKPRITYFLDSIDVSRRILNGETVEFSHHLPGDEKSQVIQEEPAVSRKSKEVATTSGPLVYIVDDELDIVELLKDMLELGGFSTRGFNSAQEALDNLKKDRPSAVFTDMNMPEITGLELLRKVTAIDPDLPVIFVSGYLTKDNIIESMNYGIFGAIEKPFKESQIISMAINATRRYELWNLVNRTMNFIMYQFTDLDDYLKDKGHGEIREMMNREFKTLLDTRKQLRESKLPLGTKNQSGLDNKRS